MPTTPNRIDHVLQRFIRDFPFFSDPIFLFNPSRIPSKEEVLSNNFGDIRYPLVDEAQKKLPDIQMRFYDIQKTFQEAIFENPLVENEYSNRVRSLGQIIRMIEIFYNPNETEKFNIVNGYFGIDTNICSEIANEGLPYIQDILGDDHMDFGVTQEQRVLLNTTIDAAEIKMYFEMALVFLGLDKKWTVELNDTVLAIVHGNFTEEGGVVYIPSSHSTSLKGLLALIIHEIDGHCRQFNYTGQYSIYGPLVRSVRSEEILEGLAVFLEHSWNFLILGEDSISKSVKNFSVKYRLMIGEISSHDFLEQSKTKSYFRVFRGFYDIDHFMNTKDFVYLQGLYKLLKLERQYGFQIFDMLYTDGLINEEYIRRNIHSYTFSKIGNIKNLLQNSSAFYILNQVLYDKK